MTQAGIEPATFRFVEQHLNHCATAVPTNNQSVQKKFIYNSLTLINKEELCRNVGSCSCKDTASHYRRMTFLATTFRENKVILQEHLGHVNINISISNRVLGKNKQNLEIHVDDVVIICVVSRNSSVNIVTLRSEVPITESKFLYLGVI